MALRKKGKYWYGDTAEDIREPVVSHSRANGYEATKFSTPICDCRGTIFKLESDEGVGAARRICVACANVQLMGDSDEYAAEAEFERHSCICDEENFELLPAVALYSGSNDVRWFYIGCRCTHCQLVGVFADYKCEAGDADEFLAKT